MSKIRLTAEKFVEDLEGIADKKRADEMMRYFKMGKGGYGEGDVFIGVGLGPINVLARKYVGMSVEELEQLLESEIHEYRLEAMPRTALRYAIEKFGTSEREYWMRLK